MLRFVKILPLYVMVVLFSGCVHIGSHAPTLDAKKAVVRVTFEYLDGVVHMNDGVIESYVAWADYLRNRGLTKADFKQQLAVLRDSSTAETHPLVNLDFVDVHFAGDDAEVKVRKVSSESAPVITVKLHWGGDAWLVVDDSIFGKDGLITEHAAKSKNT